MKWRSLRVILPTIILLFLIAGGIGFIFWQKSKSTNLQPSDHVPIKSVFQQGTIYPQNAPPTPGPARTAYTDARYGYSFTYPTEWRLRFPSQGVDDVQGQYQVNAGDGYPFELRCQANPNGLDAQAWFNQDASGEVGIGYVTLASGTTAYVSLRRGYGQGYGSYKDYTLVHGTAVCSFITFLADSGIDAINDTIVNSFTWH